MYIEDTVPLEEKKQNTSSTFALQYMYGKNVNSKMLNGRECTKAMFIERPDRKSVV